MTTDTEPATALEPVAEFRARAREWLRENLPPASPPDGDAYSEESWDRARQLQRILYDGGFAGICFPVEYGGRGLTPAHQQAFTEESNPYEMPLLLNVPTLAICAASLLDIGTEDQKRAHLPAVLRGEELLVQFLSEPRGGSDLAGLTTRADRDGERWILNGSKIWSSGAYAADYGLCLARTNWEAPKHRGLTLFLVPVHAEGVTVQRIKQVTGSTEFCQEFFDDVALPPESVLGRVDEGWEAATLLLNHERAALGGTSPYTSGARPHLGGEVDQLLQLARATGHLDDPRTREDIGEARAMNVVRDQLIDHVTAAILSGELPPSAGAITRLFSAENAWLQTDAAVRIAGSAAATHASGDPADTEKVGLDYLFRAAWSLAGGSTEMARNVISERVLGMPREYAADRNVPFNQVEHGRR
ncbi:alkylation response protein AidB-like acyl-CoA dehydrogenase [Nocardia transvalensis]|uniref:Alkylation response protein AidB-like acyl-CoA dehydrogenase n=1 Tax=Nocardia transvalensis TaxID=37333 RepID=A0A7W9PHE0_9NOCA|nr:acyl-CoA dehydrogenase family protein [Nocardia transvalensis]MBB5915578.1 alkylation response protein AidB-like acyl-CoA dehydrogenase [Nocardia transvalensis]